MSELTQCNFCRLRDTKHSAKAKGMKVVLWPSNFLSGTTVFVVPKNIKKSDIKKWKDCDKAPPNGDRNYQKYCVAWMQEIPDSCKC